MPDDAAAAASVETASAPEAPAIAAPAAPGGDWRSGLPPELQAEKSLERYKDPVALAKAYVEVEKKMGGLTPPAADAPPEQHAAYRKRIGVPESPDKYEVTLAAPPEGSGVTWNEKWLGRLKQRMHAEHARPAVVQAVLDTYVEYANETWDQFRGQQAQAETAEREEAMRVLEQRWGPRNGPQWKHHNARAVAALEHLFGDAAPAERNAIIEMAGNPHFAAGLSRLADGLLERGFVSGDQMGSGASPAEAQAKIDQIREAAIKDPNHPLNNPRHPQHERVHREYMQLHGIVAGPDAWKPIPGMVRRTP